jgi:putative phosphoesterase
MPKSVHALALSDSHGKLSAIQRALDRFGDTEYIFHLGDYDSDAKYIAEHSRAKVMRVRGNCDLMSGEPYFREIFICGQKIILTHGHQLKVKYSVNRLLYYAQENEAKAILFGHTHMPYCEFEDGIWMVNPGSVAEPRAGLPSAARLLIGDFGVVPKIVFLD